jgi:hypothetical protein
MSTTLIVLAKLFATALMTTVCNNIFAEKSTNRYATSCSDSLAYTIFFITIIDINIILKSKHD